MGNENAVMLVQMKFRQYFLLFFIPVLLIEFRYNPLTFDQMSIIIAAVMLLLLPSKRKCVLYFRYLTVRKVNMLNALYILNYLLGTACTDKNRCHRFIVKHP